MPHKRNPELTERICGLARLIPRPRRHGPGKTWPSGTNATSATPRRSVSFSPDSCYALDYILALFAQVMSGLKVMPGRMMANVELTRGIVFSQRVLLALVEKGMSREDAYALTQRYGHRAWDEGADFRDLPQDRRFGGPTPAPRRP